MGAAWAWGEDKDKGGETNSKVGPQTNALFGF